MTPAVAFHLAGRRPDLIDIPEDARCWVCDAAATTGAFTIQTHSENGWVQEEYLCGDPECGEIHDDANDLRLQKIADMQAARFRRLYPGYPRWALAVIQAVAS